ncbi:MAG: hypothetical protein ACOZAO_05860 [Patescibacteria group bacterium]
MNKVIFLVVLNLILALFQDSFLPVLLGASFAPNLIFAYAYSFTLLGLKDTSYLSLFIGGVLLDLLGLPVLGTSSAVFIILLTFSHLLNKYLLQGFSLHLISCVGAHILYLYVVNGFSVSWSLSLLFGGLFTLGLSFIFSFINKKTLFRIIDSSYIQLKFKNL